MTSIIMQVYPLSALKELNVQVFLLRITCDIVHTCVFMQIVCKV